MKFSLALVLFLSGCGLSTYGYSARYSAEPYGRLSQSEYASGSGIAVPVSAMNPLGCDPSFQLELRNRSEHHDAVVNIHRLISDGTALITAVSIPRGGSRIICLPDVGAYEFEIELFAISLGEPRRVGCYTWQREITAFVGVEGRHVQNITDESAIGGRC